MCSLLVFWGCLTSSCMQQDFSIAFERSGGLMGRIVEIELDTRSMPDEEADTLRQLVSVADLPEVQSAQDDPNMRDTFQYKIVLNVGEEQLTVELGESQIPDRVRPLIEWLGNKARSR